MKIKSSVLTVMMGGMSILFFMQAAHAFPQFALRWKFTLMMVFTGLIIVGLAIYLWKDRGLQTIWFKHNQQSLWMISALALLLIMGFLPARPVNYVNVDVEPLSNSSITNKTISIFPGEVINPPQGEITLLDWLKLFSSGNLQAYQGKEIDVSGFVVYSARSKLGQFTINRMTLTCCIPDPVPVGLGVEWKPEKPLEENTWIRVKGTINIVTINGENTPEILATQVDIIPQPDQPYLFPR